MKISARNQLDGRVVEVVKGATTAHVRVELAGGQVVTASITNEAADELQLAPGRAVKAVIKSSDVMIATE
ncbi:Molybdenum-pterin-binding protein 2 [Methylobacterium crusticola]|uniref:Molybdenum-pterin-binding protein 2 n=1 Tax=Methylobacterium crusticola TaxID=1697972 RepID=A0ABQ4R3K9_9HYPH|nr:TOBE domain-containing protein [Methylobacterium crusticola]GJD51439.1 Molybdenum-pterin-binding protein 2 [Methylobacterium crusticola]